MVDMHIPYNRWKNISIFICMSNVKYEFEIYNRLNPLGHDLQTEQFMFGRDGTFEYLPGW